MQQNAGAVCKQISEGKGAILGVLLVAREFLKIKSTAENMQALATIGSSGTVKWISGAK